jgi:hypothetical protein
VVSFFSVTSSGPVITRTTYWDSPEARRGCLYISTNHETLRILVPPLAEHVLAGLPPIGTQVDLRLGSRGGYETYRLIWQSDPSSPHVVEIDLRLCGRRWPDAEAGTVAKLIWYTMGEEGDAVQERRRELVQVGDVVAS